MRQLMPPTYLNRVRKIRKRCGIREKKEAKAVEYTRYNQ